MDIKICLAFSLDDSYCNFRLSNGNSLYYSDFDRVKLHDLLHTFRLRGFEALISNRGLVFPQVRWFDSRRTDYLPSPFVRCRIEVNKFALRRLVAPPDTLISPPTVSRSKLKPPVPLERTLETVRRINVGGRDHFGRRSGR